VLLPCRSLGPPSRAHKAAARLYDQAAAELDQAAAHCRVAAIHFRGAEGPRERRAPGRRWGISARQNCGWRSRLVPTASRRASRALCRRSPPAGARWHIRQPVLAARFTAVLSRGSSGDIEEPAGTGKGTGTQRKDRCSAGGPETSGWSPGTGGSDLAAGGAAQGRGCPPPATRRHLCPGPLRHGRSGPGLSRTRHAHRPALPKPAAVVHRRSVKGTLAALVPSGPLRWGGGALGGRRGPGRAAGWPAELC
jgi:hypothetical protein